MGYINSGVNLDVFRIFLGGIYCRALKDKVVVGDVITIGG